MNATKPVPMRQSGFCLFPSTGGGSHGFCVRTGCECKCHTPRTDVLVAPGEDGEPARYHCPRCGETVWSNEWDDHRVDECIGAAQFEDESRDV